MDGTPNQAGRVGKTLVSAGRWSRFGNGYARFSTILSNRAEAGCRFGE